MSRFGSHFPLVTVTQLLLQQFSKTIRMFEIIYHAILQEFRVPQLSSHSLQTHPPPNEKILLIILPLH